MKTSLPPAAFTINPFLPWAVFAWKPFETAMAAAQVIPIRVGRMMASGTNPTAADRREMTLMGAEKVLAFSRSGAALAQGLTPAMVKLAAQNFQAWMGLWGAFAGLASARGLPQAMARQASLASAIASHSPVLHRGSRAAAKLAHAALLPVHATATANARRLSRRK